MTASILVTGGTGFIGSHLVERLVARGAQVCVVDNLSNSRLSNLASVIDQVEFWQLDIRSADFLNFLKIKSFDVIFHFAANAYVPPSVNNPEYDFETNLVAPFRMLETLRRTGNRPIVIVASSAAVYGDPERLPTPEIEPTCPISPYGVSKLGTERYLSVYSKLFGFRGCALRLFSVFGPRQHKQIVYDFMCKLTADPSALEILGDGTQVRDLIYVGDVAQAALMALDHAPLNGEAYNVATGTGHSTREIAEHVSRAMALHPAFMFTRHVRPGDTQKWIANIDRLRELGFAPRVSFAEGIDRTAAWFTQTEIAAIAE